MVILQAKLNKEFTDFTGLTVFFSLKYPPLHSLFKKHIMVMDIFIFHMCSLMSEEQKTFNSMLSYWWYWVGTNWAWQVELHEAPTGNWIIWTSANPKTKIILIQIMWWISISDIMNKKVDLRKFSTLHSLPTNANFQLWFQVPNPKEDKLETAW